MKIHEVKRNTALKRPKNVGRGGKRGKTSGRGTKGQKARSGRKLYPEIRDIIKKIPKLRGRGKNINTSRQVAPVIITLSEVEENFKAGDTVSVSTLSEKGLIRKISGKFPPVKIVGEGKLTKKVSFVGVGMTGSAKKLIGAVSGEKK